MLKLITLEIIENHLWELHRADCKDLAKKSEHGITLDSIEEAREVVADESRIRMEETGDGFEFDDVVKVFPCSSH